jgi:ActR/RegA family two-component response regulator
MNAPEKMAQSLLIVDDREEVLRALERYMGLYLTAVYGAQTPDEAIAAMQTHAPTFLLCDFWLGEKHPPSTSLIPDWRLRFPCLKRVVLMSGTKSSSIPACDAVDAIFPKPLDLKGLVRYLQDAAQTLA